MSTGVRSENYFVYSMLYDLEWLDMLRIDAPLQVLTDKIGTEFGRKLVESGKIKPIDQEEFIASTRPDRTVLIERALIVFTPEEYAEFEKVIAYHATAEERARWISNGHTFGIITNFEAAARKYASIISYIIAEREKEPLCTRYSRDDNLLGALPDACYEDPDLTENEWCDKCREHEHVWWPRIKKLESLAANELSNLMAEYYRNDA